MSWGILFNCSLDLEYDSDASWEDAVAGQFVSANSLVVVSIVSRHSHFATALEMLLCILGLQKKEKEIKVFLFFLERLGFFGEEERFRKGKMGLSVGKTCSQQQSIVWIKCSSVIQLCPSWFCAVVGSGGELGWNSLQNTMTLMRWWGELCLKITSRNNASKMNSQDNSASSSQ